MPREWTCCRKLKPVKNNNIYQDSLIRQQQQQQYIYIYMSKKYTKNEVKIVKRKYLKKRELWL